MAKKPIRKRGTRIKMGTESAAAILADFRERKWGAHPFERALALVAAAPLTAPHLAHLTIEQVPEGGTFLDAVLSHIGLDDWPELIVHALRAREGGPNEAADSVIAHGTLQRPQALHPHLERIFAVRPNEGTYYEDWPWRGR